MDDLEFRRSVYADPSSKDEALKAAAKADPAKQAFLNEMRQFDDKLASALKVDVPDNLAQRLILRQALESHAQQRRRIPVYLAMAASIAFAIGLSFQMFNTSVDPVQDLGHYSLAHLADEIKYLNNATEQNTLAQVNGKLASFGGKLTGGQDGIFGKAIFANYCDFGGITSLHLIYQSPQGRMSVFVTPSDSGIDFNQTFGDEQYSGVGLNFEKAHVSVVGNEKQAVAEFSSQLKNNISWEI
jgi:hypothetical protein